MKNHQRLNRDHITEYQARTVKPITAHPVTTDGPPRTIPGGALVTVTENTDHDPPETVITATVYLGGQPYEAIVDANQFVPYHQPHNQ